MTSTRPTPPTLPTLMELLRARAGNAPGQVAVRRKELGVWHEITWRDYADAADAVARALHAWGVGRGDRVALAVGNRPEWLFAELGIGLAGAVPVALELDCPEEMLAETKARVLFAEDEEQLDRALAFAGPDLNRIVVLDPRGVDTGDPRVVTFADVRSYESGAVPDEPGEPEVAADDELGLRATDELLSLPVWGLPERRFSIVHHLRCGYVVNFGGAESVRADLFAVQPTVLFAPPEVWADLRREAETRLTTASPLKRSLARRAALTGDALTRAGGLPGFVAGPLMYRSLRTRLGLRRLRVARCGPEPADPETTAWFTRIGIELTQEAQR